MNKHIFATTGTQLPFDRLISSLDDWAGKNKQHTVIAQIARTSKMYNNIEARSFINPIDYELLCETSDVIVGHAGIGTILTAVKYRKPLIVMPRSFELGEHRNEHQQAIVRIFRHFEGIYVAKSEANLLRLLDSLPSLRVANAQESDNLSNLRGHIQSIIE